MSRILIVVSDRDLARDIFGILPAEAEKEVVGDPFTAVNKLWNEEFDGLILEDDMGHRVSMSEQILRMKKTEGKPIHKVPTALLITGTTTNFLAFYNSVRIVANEISTYTREAVSIL